MNIAADPMTNLLSEMLKEVKPATRRDWQLSLERNLMMFNPDAAEASELLDALIVQMKDRYEGSLAEVLDAFRDLKDALAELDATHG